MNDLLSLEQRLDFLEKQVEKLSNKNNSSLFGRSYSLVGTSESDLILKTRGLVKIQWGKKFIDLIKNGKINTDCEFIFKASSTGDRDGIYIIEGNSPEVWLVSGETKLNLLKGDGTTFVSFMGEQNTSSTQKYQALVNIGFIYETILDITEFSLKNGIVYIESEKKLYTISNGVLQEYSMDLSTINKLFIIDKNDSDKGALVIKGEGIENSIAFDSLLIYNYNKLSIIDSLFPVLIKVENTPTALFEKKNISVSTLKADTIKSLDSGYSIEKMGEEYVLTIDRINERNSSNSLLSKVLCPSYFLLSSNIVLYANFQEVLDSDNKIVSEIKLMNLNKYSVGDILLIFINKLHEREAEQPDKFSLNSSPALIDSQESITEYLNIPLYLTVIESKDNSIVVEMQTSEQINLEDFANSLVFLIQPSLESVFSGSIPLLLSDGNIEITEYSNTHPLLKIGNLIGLFSESTPLIGIYSSNAFFDLIKYTGASPLENTDNSENLASTKWVQNLINSKLPKGIICQIESGKEVPNGWVLCDGNNGTPELNKDDSALVNYIMNI